jgi:uridine phosphorylase
MIRVAVPIHIRPTAPLAERALLPADPGLALALAQSLLEAPRMFNHNLGLWGYTGRARDGAPMTIQSTGVGGPSAAIVLEELIALGLIRAIRLGTCTGLTGVGRRDDEAGAGGPLGSGDREAEAGGPLGSGDREAEIDGPLGSGDREAEAGGPLGLGDLLVADTALAGDGTSRALGVTGWVGGDPGLGAALCAASPTTRRGCVSSGELFYDPDPVDTAARAFAAGAVARDLESAALFAVGARRIVPIACVLVVTDVDIDGRRRRIDDDQLEAACERAGRAAATALGAGASAEAGRGAGARRAEAQGAA